MDSRLKQALEFANLRQTLHLEKVRLKEKLKLDLTIPYNGGIFHIDRNLIVFLNLITPDEDNDPVVVLDDNDNPVIIDDLKRFKEIVTSTYFKAINQYASEIEALKRKRSTQAFIGL